MQVMKIFIVLLQLIITSDSFSDKIILSKNYSRDSVPYDIDGNPVKVVASCHLQNILDVNEEKQEISLEMSIRLHWTDPRIKPDEEHLQNTDSIGTYANVDSQTIDEIWFPDIYFPNAIDVRTPKFLRETSFLRIYRNSLLKFSKRFNLDSNCKMEFHMFPLDVQVCDIKIETWGYSNKQIDLRWKENSSTVIYDIKML